ncbi:MAG TPA: helix-turn-helix domain-containing protein [Thermoanaerobaculia bacterium]|jgi:DNA-binding XRE family transcriptional regulator|nr:helix-turn-helix domain-containing protein [Thermoanaerobaculia bacterium]
MAKRELKTWAEIKTRRPLSAVAEKANTEWVEQQIVELNLQALRQQLGVTQAELAESSGFAQGEISRIEQREDHMVSTLRRLVRSLGGDLEIHARFPDGRDIRLIGV